MIIRRRNTSSGICILDLSGNLTIVDGAGPLRDTVQDVVDEGISRVLLNLREISHIDSAGIGSIVASYTLLSQKRGDLKLLGVDRKLSMILSAVESFDSEAEALESF